VPSQTVHNTSSRIREPRSIDRRASPPRTRVWEISLGNNDVLEVLTAELDDYFTGKSARFQVPTIQNGTAFEEAVWKALQQIRPGQTRSSGDIAQELGQPEKSREVGRTNGANKISIIVPCHRVIGTDGSLVGYGGGFWRKKWLLDRERRYAWPSFEHA